MCITYFLLLAFSASPSLQFAHFTPPLFQVKVGKDGRIYM